MDERTKTRRTIRRCTAVLVSAVSVLYPELGATGDVAKVLGVGAFLFLLGSAALQVGTALESEEAE